MFLSTGLKRVRLLGMGTHFFPKNLARGMLIRVGTFIRDTIVLEKCLGFSCTKVLIMESGIQAIQMSLVPQHI